MQRGNQIVAHRHLAKLIAKHPHIAERRVLNGIARIEARAWRAGINEIGLEDLGTAKLTNDGRRAGRAGAKRAA